ncbi:ral guanine nucleotide dissociation stimulator-like isoform X3 [Diceros bicornis minor]|uniref:ral guanine nucleotide dissociation stimulator-like isoform X3 n=1 Tax=Diceros bicornis minor TaxID=77932 RepID=UPI0026E993B2|nr:ral guanine nucleotide dissociation stimulator-like isoform X3 [Diceros bicornis minor]
MTKEGPSTFAPPEIIPQRVQEKQQQQQVSVQGVVPYLGTFLGDLLMLHLVMGDYLEEYRVMREILLLQVAAKNYNLEPEERFGAWFQDMELLNENDRRRFVMQLLRLHLGLLPSCLCCLHTRLSSIPARTYVMLFQEEMSWRPQPLSAHAEQNVTVNCQGNILIPSRLKTKSHRRLQGALYPV